MQTKTCKRCEETKPLSQFGNTVTAKDGLVYRARCAPCHAAWRKEYESSSEVALKIKKRVRGPRKKAYNDTWRAANRDKLREYERKRQKQDKGRSAEVTARRKADYGRRSFEYDREAVLAIYRECSRRTEEEGIRYHVDHEVPLRGKKVCGLHVSWNLRIVTKEENEAKGNRFQG